MAGFSESGEVIGMASLQSPKGEGGAIFLTSDMGDPSVLVLSNTSFLRNRASYMGGGLSVQSESQVHSTDYRVAFVNNTAGAPGCELLFRDHDPNLYTFGQGNSIFAGSGKVMYYVCTPGTYFPGYSDPVQDGNIRGCPARCVCGETQDQYTLAESCTACPVGSFCPDSTQTPVPCPQGRFGKASAAIAEDVGCTSCPQGWYQEDAGQQFCLPW